MPKTRSSSCRTLILIDGKFTHASGDFPAPRGGTRAGDLDGIVADYSEDAIFITPAGVKRGKDGIREAFTQLLGELPNADWDIKTTIYEEDIMLLDRFELPSSRV